MGTGENNPDRVFLPHTPRNPDDLAQQPDPAKRQQPATPQPQIRPPPTSLKYRLCPHLLGRLGTKAFHIIHAYKKKNVFVL